MVSTLAGAAPFHEQKASARTVQTGLDTVQDAVRLERSAPDPGRPAELNWWRAPKREGEGFGARLMAVPPAVRRPNESRASWRLRGVSIFRAYRSSVIWRNAARRGSVSVPPSPAESRLWAVLNGRPFSCHEQTKMAAEPKLAAIRAQLEHPYDLAFTPIQLGVSRANLHRGTIAAQGATRRRGRSNL